MLERLLAYHCAPALAGIKPANIASCRKSRFGNLHSDINKLNNQLNKKDIYIEILCESDNRALIIVYRRSVLEHHLKSHNNKAFLSCYGYSENSTLSSQRLNQISRAKTLQYSAHTVGVTANGCVIGSRELLTQVLI